tara:strand:+ start:1478 stop:2089 length:612 start_codon:yes stop_codon:yes gene_type:complete
MAKYKITGENSDQVRLVNDDGSVTVFSKGSWQYVEFVNEVKGKGYSIVEGPTVGVTTAYNISRQAEYPSIVDQLDKIYHDGVDAWKTDIKIIKDKYPKSQVGVTTVAEVPDWVQTEVNVLIKNDYLQAVERLKQPRVALGKKVLVADNYWDPNQNKVIEGSKYTYINVPSTNDSLVVSDEAERDSAQATIDKTPQSIIDSINT